MKKSQQSQNTSTMYTDTYTSTSSTKHCDKDATVPTLYLNKSESPPITIPQGHPKTKMLYKWNDSDFRC